MQTETYQRIIRSTKTVSDMDELEAAKVPIYKLFLYSEDKGMLGELKQRLEQNKEIAVASSFLRILRSRMSKHRRGRCSKSILSRSGTTWMK